MYEYLKALHIIFITTWFAGLFYIVRLFVYQIEANEKPSPEREILLKQYKIMTYRLWYIITWPSAILAVLFALSLLYINPSFLEMRWMQVKLGFVILLIFYQIKCQLIYKELQNDEFNYSSNFMRLWNEGATIILFAVVFLVVLKNEFNWIFGVLGIILFSLLIMLGFKFYKRLREQVK